MSAACLMATLAKLTILCVFSTFHVVGSVSVIVLLLCWNDLQQFAFCECILSWKEVLAG